jgi:hypothetical protein
MTRKQLFLLLTTSAMIFPSLRTLADSQVTFELVATFQGPGRSVAVAKAINNHGDVGGWCGLHHGVAGFVRLRNGHFSDPISEPDSTGATYITGLNSTGTASGYYETNTGTAGFFYSNGVFTSISLDPSYPYVQEINDAGNYCGFTLSGAFVSIGGTVIPFNIDGEASDADGMNNLDQVVGGYEVDGINYGYRRDADGTLAYPFAVPGQWFTALRGINDDGLMVGTTAGDLGTQGVVFLLSGSFVLYTYPGGYPTSFEGVNNRGLICGYYLDERSEGHAFVLRMRSAAASNTCGR